ncbi:hypothetical protein V6N12_062975 [Hibiscus sabdariffa]|uniref:Bulb-type lectin domain-containing protein n=1 Tax=Hibiscus sabdariffa TaxID=183260 RepID=A0ABR2FAE4_9ROSI
MVAVMKPVKFHLRILLVFLLSHCSFSADTITRDQSIKDNNDDVIVSSGKIFALGFFSPGSSTNRYVGIWYHQIPEKTIVWVANRDKPIKDKSGILSIDGGGNLALFQRNQTFPVWSTNMSITDTGDSIATILDSGNLVLLQNDARRTVLWQSFDHPTNTWLSLQSLGLNIRTGLSLVFTSWKSPDDPGVGDYSFEMNPAGFPQIFLYKGSTPLWRSGTWTGHSWSGIPEMTKNILFNDSFVYTDDEVTFLSNVRNASFISRTVTNETGILQRLTWNNEEQSWIVFSSTPKESCDFYGAYSEIGRGTGCLTWHGDLLDVRAYTNTGQDLYIRVDKNELARYTKKSLLQKKGVIAFVIVSSAVVFLILVSVFYCLVRQRRSAARTRNSKHMFSITTFEGSLGEKEIDESRRNGDLPFFHFSTIAVATNNFSSDNKLGQGGFGPVYKGVLLNDFGLARIFGGDETEGDTKRIVGTYGYMSPDPSLNLVGHVWELWKEGKAMEVVDSELVRSLETPAHEKKKGALTHYLVRTTLHSHKEGFRGENPRLAPHHQPPSSIETTI